MAMNSCPVCNAEILSDAAFCPKCGYALKAQALPESQTLEIRQLLLSGKKIEAIKVYREATGLGLKESKDGVETVERELRNVGLLPPKTRSGCFTVLILLPILLALYCILF